ncbi:transcriptional regulator [Legionella steigerwaltii]|uniref:Transcriptional regulator n=1 Tax=Legionella steigerwaltii TaxID=460 RepID=A0A378LAL7_9GAMM|nr:transglycosylase SLT domain-containing protein [Legionella steigerwaltii]KTD77598.1 transcriptional regulator [Legionella steigerwaltii]STY22908.1 transcriptional regulator [Legionella steigerwaltii]
MDALLHMFKKLRIALFLLFAVVLTACVSHPPADVNNLCNIFRQYPKWYRDAKDVERRWRVPIPVQMAIIHQESKFNARARPPRQKLFCIIPWKRPSSAYGYTQALHGTWNHYKQSCGGWFASRDDFGDGVDFIGWYANEAYKRARVPRTDAYSLYLAYHEGIGGYLRKTYLRKSWLIPVARKVKARSQLYAMQLNSCKKL